MKLKNVVIVTLHAFHHGSDQAFALPHVVLPRETDIQVQIRDVLASCEFMFIAYLFKHIPSHTLGTRPWDASTTQRSQTFSYLRVLAMAWRYRWGTKRKTS